MIQTSDKVQFTPQKNAKGQDTVIRKSQIEQREYILSSEDLDKSSDNENEEKYVADSLYISSLMGVGDNQFVGP